MTVKEVEKYIAYAALGVGAAIIAVAMFPVRFILSVAAILLVASGTVLLLKSRCCRKR